jgi:hypothetical protein
LGGTRIYGPDRVNNTVEIGMFTDPKGHVVGVLAAASDADHVSGGSGGEHSTISAEDR